MKIEEIKSLLTEFEYLPKSASEPTYLEICRYPFRRFEEICTRMLCFFFDPNGQHGLNDLFLNSLLEVIEPGLGIGIKYNGLDIVNEESTDEGKRLDIIIKSRDFIIGIENKITANLYNPLESYSNLTRRYKSSTEKIYNVVLTVNRIEKKNELALMAAHGFINVTYYDLITKIRSSIGQYLNNSNAKYLLYANDFMQTLENMNNHSVMNPQLDNFFYENKKSLDELVQLYSEFEERVIEFQKQKIASLNEEIIAKTKDDKWWIHDGWIMGYNEFGEIKRQLGVEGHFLIADKNPVAKFLVYVIAWNAKAWKKHEPLLRKDFPNEKFMVEDGMNYVNFAELNGDDDESILNAFLRAKEYVQELIKGDQ